ncbi:MAG: sulfatase-like hydrolase/transferase [Opitutaceae bacterium]|jgi:hypothetical protein|nr:sulfatase-like hydrolase/transferase [Opitutaceae bacterium]
MQTPATHLASFLSGIAASAVVLSSGPAQATEREAAPARPNIIFILAAAGYGDAGFNGQASFNTPNIDRLAREGMIMTRHYAGSPVCTPSRAALELHDSSRDPEEKSNLSSQNSGRIEYFARLMASARVTSTAFPLVQPVAEGELEAP